MQQMPETGTHARSVMLPSNASTSGTSTIGGDIVVNRLGFGAMRLTGEGI